MSASPTIRLEEIAFARSGDKGNHANVAVVAYTPAGFEHLRQVVTPERLQAYFTELDISAVERYELPRIGAINFVLRDALAGGASGSLRIDTQGKLLGPAVMRMPIPAPDGLEHMRRGT
jgi:hypothetical protein